MQPEGFNPLRWSCEKDGCFNVKRRPKIEVFAECFPRRINFGDVDGLVELNGKFALLEWKGDGGSLRRGQSLAFAAMTRTNGNIVFVVHGNAETMNVTAYEVLWRGTHWPLVEANLADLKQRIRGWAEWIDGQKAVAA